jgi:hypothetical protein
MRSYTVDELKAILAEHAKWIRNEGGTCANLSRADLSRADLSRADLSRANLSGANLSGADLSRANLSDANLSRADLSRANLSRADLSRANLSDANLYGADLSRANLSRADLSRADLYDANLSRANLYGANLSRADLSGALNIPAFQICEGDLIVYKKIEGRIVTLAIPKDAKRTASIVGRKCRTEYALVLEIEGHKSVTSNGCNNSISTLYEEGKEVRADSYDDDFRVECSHGIHFFLTRKEAEEWNQ